MWRVLYSPPSSPGELLASYTERCVDLELAAILAAAPPYGWASRFGDEIGSDVDWPCRRHRLPQDPIRPHRLLRGVAPVALLVPLSVAIGAQESGPTAAMVTPATPIEEPSRLAPLCVGPALLVTREGETIQTARGFEIEGTRVRYLSESGTLVAVRRSEIDIVATEVAERIRCADVIYGETSARGTAGPTQHRPAGTSRRDPVGEAIDAIVELGVGRAKLEALAKDPPAFRAAVDAVVAVAGELERRTREIELSYRLDTVGGMVAAAPAYRQLAAFVRETARGEPEGRIRGVLEDLAVAFDEVALLASEDPERAIEAFRRQAPGQP
jgi:hypothetical protein